MGHHHSVEQPDKPGCVWREGIFHSEGACNNEGMGGGNGNGGGSGGSNGPTTVNVYPSGSSGRDSGSTLVRLYVGSHESTAMGGSAPSVAVFDEFGQRIGQHEVKSKTSAAGGFKDIVVKQKKEVSTVRPSYLLLHGGEKPICVSAIAMQFPDGAKQFFTGEDVSLCDNRLQTSDSRTFFGPDQDQPRCFWVGGGKDDGKAVHRLSLHLPDYVHAKARLDAYKDNEELGCRRTPRFWTNNYDNRFDLKFPVPIFNPVIEYNADTHFDKYPNRVLSWGFPKEDSRKDFSDFPFEARPSYSNSTAIRGRSYQRDVNGEPDLTDFTVEAFVGGQVEEEQVRTEAPKLVISEKDLSAVEQCRYGKWEQTDFVSLSEQIYCDMQSRTMFPVCSDNAGHACWNSDTKQLQGLQAMGATQAKAVSDSAAAWTATGPLFGFTYLSVSTIA